MAAPDTQVTLGGITFSAFAVPQQINAGGAQTLGTHKLPGGVRIVDAMGADDDDIALTGYFYAEAGTTPLQQSRYLDYLRRQGDQVSFTYFDFSYLVVVKKFTFDVERYYQIGFQVTLEVVQDLTAPVSTPPATVDDYVSADMTNALTGATNLGMTVPGSMIGPTSTTPGASPIAGTAIVAPTVSAGQVDLTALAADLTTLRSTINGTPSFVGASPSSAAAAQAALAAVAADLSAGIAPLEVTLASAPAASPGNVVAGQDGMTNAAAFLAYQAAAEQDAELGQVAAYVARMTANIGLGAV